MCLLAGIYDLLWLVLSWRPIHKNGNAGVMDHGLTIRASGCRGGRPVLLSDLVSLLSIPAPRLFRASGLGQSQPLPSQLAAPSLLTASSCCECAS